MSSKLLSGDGGEVHGGEVGVYAGSNSNRFGWLVFCVWSLGL
jgi:hypothetical protein